MNFTVPPRQYDPRMGYYFTCPSCKGRYVSSECVQEHWTNNCKLNMSRVEENVPKILNYSSLNPEACDSMVVMTPVTHEKIVKHEPEEFSLFEINNCSNNSTDDNHISAGIFPDDPLTPNDPLAEPDRNDLSDPLATDPLALNDETVFEDADDPTSVSVNDGSNNDGDYETRFKCRFCPRQFPFPSGLAAHERIHTGERPFVCNVCGKGFAVSSTLNNHRRVHMKEVPLLKCKYPGCSQMFRTRVTRWLHGKSHPPGPWNATRKVITRVVNGKITMIRQKSAKTNGATPCYSAVATVSDAENSANEEYHKGIRGHSRRTVKEILEEARKAQGLPQRIVRGGGSSEKVVRVADGELNFVRQKPVRSRELNFGTPVQANQVLVPKKVYGRTRGPFGPRKTVREVLEKARRDPEGPRNTALSSEFASQEAQNVSSSYQMGSEGIENILESLQNCSQGSQNGSYNHQVSPSSNQANTEGNHDSSNISIECSDADTTDSVTPKTIPLQSALSDTSLRAMLDAAPLEPVSSLLLPFIDDPTSDPSWHPTRRPGRPPKSFSKSSSISGHPRRTSSEAGPLDFAPNVLDHGPSAGRRRFACEYCGAEFALRTVARDHTYTHMNRPMHPCNFPGCNKVFWNRVTRWKHTKEDHGGTYVPSVSKPMPAAPRQFAAPLQHAETRSSDTKEEPSYPCGMCGLIFPHISALKQHMKVHSDATAGHTDPSGLPYDTSTEPPTSMNGFREIVITELPASSNELQVNFVNVLTPDASSETAATTNPNNSRPAEAENLFMFGLTEMLDSSPAVPSNVSDLNLFGEKQVLRCNYVGCDATFGNRTSRWQHHTTFHEGKTIGGEVYKRKPRGESGDKYVCKYMGCNATFGNPTTRWQHHKLHEGFPGSRLKPGRRGRRPRILRRKSVEEEEEEEDEVEEILID